MRLKTAVQANKCMLHVINVTSDKSSLIAVKLCIDIRTATEKDVNRVSLSRCGNTGFKTLGLFQSPNTTAP